MKTNQEIFDFVLDALRKQGVASHNERQDICMYRGPNSTKCAAGHLIPDDAYTRQMEGKAFFVMYRDYAKIKHMINLWQQVSIDLIEAMQRAHDRDMPRMDTRDPERLQRWEATMALIAADYKLSYRPA